MYFGIASFSGRIVIGRLGDCRYFISSHHVVEIGFLTMAVSCLLLPSARGYTAFVVFSVVYGFCEGAVGSQMNLLFLTTVSPKLRAAAFGYATCFISFTMMTGLTVAGLFVHSFLCLFVCLFVYSNKAGCQICVTTRSGLQLPQ